MDKDKVKKYLHMSNFKISNYEDYNALLENTENKDLTDKGNNELTLF